MFEFLNNLFRYHFCDMSYKESLIPLEVRSHFTDNAIHRLTPQYFCSRSRRVSKTEAEKLLKKFLCVCHRC